MTDKKSLGSRLGWSAVVEILEILSGTMIFLVLARVLTTSDYGIMGGIVGAAMPALSLSNLGTHILLMRRAARGENLQEAWKKALTLGCFGPALAVVLMLAIHPLLYPQGNVPWGIYALFVLTGLPLLWLERMVGFLPVGLGDLKSAAVVRASTFACRVAALGWFALFSGQELMDWAIAHTFSFAVAGVVGVLFVSRRYGLTPGVTASGLGSDIKEGTPFSLNGATESLFDGADRVLLVRYGLTDDAGIYALGARITQFGYAPIRMLMRSFDTDLYKAGGRSLTAAFGVTKKMFAPGMGLALATAAVFWLCAPLVPLLLGDEWSEAVPAIRLLAVLPALRSVQYLFGNTLSAADLQQWRLGGTAAAAVFNIVLNVALLPTGTWRTAVATTFVSEVLLVVLLASLVGFRLRRESTSVERSS